MEDQDKNAHPKKKKTDVAPLVLPVENALSGEVVCDAVTVEKGDTVSKLNKSISKHAPWGMAYTIVVDTGERAKPVWKAHKRLQGSTCIRVLPVPLTSEYKCGACGKSIFGNFYRSRVTGKLLCAADFIFVEEHCQHMWQHLRELPTVKSLRHCVGCKTNVWGDCLYLTPLGEIYCTHHAQALGDDLFRLCSRMDASTLHLWRRLKRKAPPQERLWRNSADGMAGAKIKSQAV
jgi:hypothetical protein